MKITIISPATCTSANADDGGFLTQQIIGEDDDLSLLSVLTFPVLLTFVFSVLTEPRKTLEVF